MRERGGACLELRGWELLESFFPLHYSFLHRKRRDNRCKLHCDNLSAFCLSCLRRAVVLQLERLLSVSPTRASHPIPHAPPSLRRGKMFTGIIEEIGTVVSLTKDPSIILWNGDRGEGWILVIRATVALGGA
jgi:hypothetical protein